jgi:hypothetical protein
MRCRDFISYIWQILFGQTMLAGDNPPAANSQKAKASGRPASPDGQLVEWWKVRPKQDAKPRQNAMAPGSAGRFLMNEVTTE